MQFQDYLNSSKKLAEIEESVLDELLIVLVETSELDRFKIRAARSSMQVLIENGIGKARRILKHYNCPLVPTRSRDAIEILFSTGAIEDEMYTSLMAAIGFRNAMIHDYMNFDESILISIIKEKRYKKIVQFIVSDLNISGVTLKRIENYTL